MVRSSVSSFPHSPGTLSTLQDPSLPEVLYFQNLLESAHAESRTIIYVDITDYLIFFRHNASATGIQRVVHYLVKYADFTGICRNASIVYCFTHPETGAFAEISPRKLYPLIEAVDQGGTKAQINKYAISIFADAFYTHLLPFRAVDILVIPGGPWATLVQLNLYALEKPRIGFRCYCVTYDLIPIDYPEFVARGVPEVFTQCYYMLSRIADGFLAISKYSAESLRDYEKRKGIQRHNDYYNTWRLGDFDTDMPVSPENVPSELEDFVASIQKNNFILTVSTIEPRKNHQALLRAWRLLKQYADLHQKNLPALVFAGKIGWNSDNLIEQVHSLRAFAFPVYVLDGMSDLSINWLYSNCLFTVMPSYVEGWGLSISESMMRGKVCLTSKTSSMVEASCGIAPLFDPFNTRELYHMLQGLIYDDKLTRHQQDLTHYQAVSWRSSAEEFYRHLSEMHSTAVSPTACLEAEPFPISRDNSFTKSWHSSEQLVFSIKDHQSKLANLPCWRPHLHNSLLLPFSDQPWIDFSLCNEDCIISFYLSALPGQHAAPLPQIVIYNACQDRVPTRTKETILPMNESVLYVYLPREHSEELWRTIRVVLSYRDPKQDSGRDPSVQCVLTSHASGLRKIAFSKQAK